MIDYHAPISRFLTMSEQIYRTSESICRKIEAMVGTDERLIIDIALPANVSDENWFVDLCRA